MKNKKGRTKSQAKAREKNSENINNISKTKFSQNKGITLIALVVTIIILIILAVISINMIFGNSGLFDTARSTRQYQANATTDEEGRLGELENAIKQQGGTGGGSSGSGGSTDRTGLKIGDYVNYTPNTAEGYKYNLSTTYSGYDTDQEVAQDTALKWKILNIHEDGSVDLVSATPTSTKVHLEGATGYNNGVFALDELCNKLYSNTAKGIQARSIDIEDLEAHLTPAGVTAKNNFISERLPKSFTDDDDIAAVDTTNNTVTYKKDHSYYPNIYAKENGSGIDSTITKTDGINVSDPNEIDTNTADDGGETGAYKQAETNLTAKFTYYNIPINNENYGEAADVLNKDKATIINNYGQEVEESRDYWVASRGTDCSYISDYACFGINLASSNLYMRPCFLSYRGGIYEQPYFLRPVVTLGAEVRLSQCTGENSSTNMHTIK